ncbi:tryptophan synthase subunit alpha [Rubritalea marina]|uniref:tryptophan synthase subunit alpha n=1 Tax=Rubritalea marina TaxID=361055 RepID=UPI00036467AE|nr:tryptophan synthase subunit alpha [Rubritalea marina]
MSNRIDTTFQKLAESNTPAFVAYVAAGDPSLEKSLEIIKGLADAGADVIELGVPFSDPLADGVVNQLAAERALKAGCTFPKVLDLIRDFRKTHETPIVLFTYLNPIYTYGFDQFHTDAAAAGADGVLLLDLPPDEVPHNAELSAHAGLKHITLIAPTSPDERIAQLAKQSEGFIYALSRTGVTGAQAAPSAAIGATVEKIKQHTDTPVCIGFGINTPEQAKMVGELSDGVVVGSAIVSQVAAHVDAEDVAAKVAAFATPLIQAAKGQ